MFVAAVLSRDFVMFVAEAVGFVERCVRSSRSFENLPNQLHPSMKIQ